MPAPCCVNRDLCNRRKSGPSTCPPGFSDGDDRMKLSDSDTTQTPFIAVVPNGTSLQDLSRLVGEDSTVEVEAGNDPEASFPRSTRARRPPERLSVYGLINSAALVIQALNKMLEPISATEALSAPDAKQWIKALETGDQELMRNHVWELVDRHHGVKMLKNKWVFVRKRNVKGEVCRYRTRIAIKKCQQEFDISFWETYAPVGKPESVNFFLLALFLGLLCRQLDFVTFF